MGVVGEERGVRRVVELALECKDRRSLHEHVLDVLDQAVGFDKASLSCFEGARTETHARGYDRIAAFEHLDHYMNELEPQEIAEAFGGRPIVDVDSLSARRRDCLALYHELLRPERVTVFSTAMWHDEHGVFGLALSRTSRGARFSASELRAIEQLIPAIRLADRYAGLRQREPIGSSFESWVDDAGLSAKEREVTALVVRGLANGEIAALLGVSPNTVRNQLSSVFRKADVSTRAELVFVATTHNRPRGAGEKPHWMAHLR